jgi:tetratricopeptide (TPR) repeat protein
MDIFGLEARQSDLARGIVIVKCRDALTRAEQRELWHALAAAGITEDDSDETAADDGEPPLRLLTAPWLPPLTDEIATQRAGLEAAHTAHPIEAVWFVKVETGIDGEAWQDLRATHLAEQREVAAEEAAHAQVPPAEVLYSAPDAPPTLTLWPAREAELGEGTLLDPDDLEMPTDRSSIIVSPRGSSLASTLGHTRGDLLSDPLGDDLGDELARAPTNSDDEDDDDEDDDMRDDLTDLSHPDSVIDLLMAESHWRNGAPPTERSVPFPVEGYPEILDEEDGYDWREFGIVLKLGGSALTGEDSVINAFFALWLSAYQDERIESFEPFSRADVAHDRAHRSALLWVERFMVPATAADQVHFLLWIIHRLHEIVPVAWARFDFQDESTKIRRDDDGEIELILAGNPFAERMGRYGEDEALSWAVAQSGWSRIELAAMLIEVALDYQQDNPAEAAHMERLLRRALAFDRSSDATPLLMSVLVARGRIAEASTMAAAGRPALRLYLARAVVEHSPKRFDEVLPLLDAETMEAAEDEELAELAHVMALLAPELLPVFLAATPSRLSLLTPLYNATFGPKMKREHALLMLRRVLSLPEPDKTWSEARAALVMAWNNACIYAHSTGQLELARQLADGAMPYGPENPNIYHSAACAYASQGETELALAAIRSAIAHDYDNIEKMETDEDLAPLFGNAEFAAIFAEWRHQRADLN